MKYYLIGIKGAGMSSLAKLLKDLGNEVCGSDYTEYYFTEDSLIEKGIEIYSFDVNNVKEEYFYIIGNAYPKNHIEVEEVILKNYSYMYYHEFISNFLNKNIIACSGTHGKTTVAYLITNMLKHECNYIIGDGEGGGYNNDTLVLEACEYRRHFINYKTKILIINNIELDHTDYYKNAKDLISAFQTASNNSELILVNGDDKNIKKIKHPNKITFGFKKNNDIKIKILSETKTGYYIQIKYNNNYYIKVPYLGKHMIYNYVASYIACILHGQKPDCNFYSLPKRRLEVHELADATLILDYAHHPTEIKALYDVLKLKYPNQKLNVIFQPHTYERTLKFKRKFKKILNLFDNVILMDVFTSKREISSINKQCYVDKYFNKFCKYNESVLDDIKNSNDVWVLLGAGNAGSILNLL